MSELPQDARNGPIFVVGSMRSGSTMLRLILDSHPSIAIGGETGFMGALLATKEIPSWKFGHRWYERLGWSETEMDERLRAFYAGLFERHAQAQGKPRWGEKTPFHTAHIGEMAQVFPDATFVGIVRHPGAVAASLRRRFHYTFAEALDYWTSTNRDMVRAASRLSGRFALLRYEDLVQAEKSVLRELLRHLDEPWSDQVLEHHRVQRERGAPRVAEGNTLTHEPVDPRRAGQWVGDVGTEERRLLAGCAPLAGFFGYAVTESEPPAPWDDPVEPYTWLLTGTALARRRASSNGTVDFDAVGSEPIPDAAPEELARRLLRAEAALARARSRRAVRYVDALRKVQHGRSSRDVREAWRLVRSSTSRSRQAP